MLREELEKYNVKKIANELGIKQATIYRWLNGEGIDRQINFIKLLKRLNIDIDEYIKYYEENKKD
jgi:transcriptional regulator with XRE-family HTH domain